MKIDYIVPTYNSAKTLEKCLSDIEEYGSPNQIICPDKMSDDGTREIIEKHDGKIIDCTASLGKARRIGAKNASTDWIGFVDSDVFVGEGWTKISHHINEDIGAVQADVNNICNKYSYILDTSPKLKGLFRPFTGATLIRKRLVKECTVIDYCQAFEDWFLGRCINEQGYKWKIVPLSVHHKFSHSESARKRAWHSSALRCYLQKDLISWSEFFILYFSFLLLYLQNLQFANLFYWFKGLVNKNWFDMER